jgi:hypothetical protein
LTGGEVLLLVFGLVVAGFATGGAVIEAVLAQSDVELALAQTAVFVALASLLVHFALRALELAFSKDSHK